MPGRAGAEKLGAEVTQLSCGARGVAIACHVHELSEQALLSIPSLRSADGLRAFIEFFTGADPHGGVESDVKRRRDRVEGGAVRAGDRLQGPARTRSSSAAVLPGGMFAVRAEVDHNDGEFADSCAFVRVRRRRAQTVVVAAGSRRQLRETEVPTFAFRR